MSHFWHFCPMCNVETIIKLFFVYRTKIFSFYLLSSIGNKDIYTKWNKIFLKKVYSLSFIYTEWVWREAKLGHVLPWLGPLWNVECRMCPTAIENTALGLILSPQEFKSSRMTTRAARSDTEGGTGLPCTSTAASRPPGAGACGRMTALSGTAIIHWDYDRSWDCLIWMQICQYLMLNHKN